MLSSYVREMRIKHWYKAFIVFSGPLFSGSLFSLDVFRLILTFLAFGFVASSVYVVNDIQDREKDRKHPKKRYRPIASGEIPLKVAYLFAAGLLVTAVLLSVAAGDHAHYFVIGYFLLMVAYTFYLKSRAIIDVFAIAGGFLLRAVAGCLVSGIKVTPFFYMVIFSFAVYLAFCKRVTEILLAGKDHRGILEVYENVAEIGIGISGATTLALYGIYTINSPLAWSVPLAFLGLMLHLRETFQGKEVHESLTNSDVVLAGLAFVIAVAIALY